MAFRIVKKLSTKKASTGWKNLMAIYQYGCRPDGDEIEGAQRRICGFLDLDRSLFWQVPERDPAR